jgi:DNA-binding NtrC family response regulator
MTHALSAGVRRQARAVAQLAATNPFCDAWTALEAEALGSAVVKRERPWSLGADASARRENLQALEALGAELVVRLRRALDAGAATAEDAALYREVALFDLYNRAIAPLDELVASGAHKKVTAYREHKEGFARAFDVDVAARPGFGAAHAFAGFFQIRRAFFHTFGFLVGTSRATAQLRASVWEAVFTADATRYRRALVERMRDVPTLVLGETGTGKEVVARAIGMSGFVPFLEERLAFAGDPRAAFFPVHLQAMSPTLIESALFGHKKGAFTGALADRTGLFAACPPWGAVFLDEVGELAPELQTKLLRVLETRDFAALGENTPARFVGRVIAATNRDLPRAIKAGAFREDMYFRLAGVTVRTPSLRARLRDDASELSRLVAYLSDHIAGPVEGPSLARATEAALAVLPNDHPWPGNVRELAQHVRSVLVRGVVDVSVGVSGGDVDVRGNVGDGEAWLAAARAGTLSADALLTHYVRHVHAEVGTYEGAARVLGLDRRTVRARVHGAAGVDGVDE